jgi:hypothetical protein
MEGFSRVVSTSWPTFHLRKEDEESARAAHLERTINTAVRDFLVSVDYRPVSFVTRVEYREAEREAEIIVHCTEVKHVGKEA